MNSKCADWIKELVTSFVSAGAVYMHPLVNVFM